MDMFCEQKSLKTDGGVKELFADPERDNVAESVADKRVENPAAGEEDIYVGQGRYMKGDSKKLPKKENLGFFIGATGGFAGGEENLWNFRDGVYDNDHHDCGPNPCEKNTSSRICDEYS